MGKNEKGFAPVITLLFVAFVLTAYVAIKSQNQMVLGEDVENMAPTTEIRDVKLKELRNNQIIELRNKEGKINATSRQKILNFKSDDDSLSLKVKESTPTGETAERLERDVKIKPSMENGLEIQDRDRSVRTDFPININQTENTISVTTPNGEVKVKELPSTAIDKMIEKGMFNTVSDISIEESGDGQTDAVLNVNGEKTYKFLGVLPVRAKVRAEVNQETGDISKLNTPWFISTFGFLFSK